MFPVVCRKEPFVQHQYNDERQSTSVATEVYIPGLQAVNSSEKTLIAHKTNTAAVSQRYPPDPQKSTGTIRVLLVDDHALMREGLRQLLELEDDLRVSG